MHFAYTRNDGARSHKIGRWLWQAYRKGVKLINEYLFKEPSTKDVRQNLGFSNHPLPLVRACPNFQNHPLPGRPRPDFSILPIFQFLHIFIFAH